MRLSPLACSLSCCRAVSCSWALLRQALSSQPSLADTLWLSCRTCSRTFPRSDSCSLLASSACSLLLASACSTWDTACEVTVAKVPARVVASWLSSAFRVCSSTPGSSSRACSIMFSFICEFSSMMNSLSHLLCSRWQSHEAAGREGNSMLLRVLPALYEKQPRPIHARLQELVAPMAQLDPPEQLHLLRLLHTVARKRELGVLRECLPFLFGHLRDPNHSEAILNILLEISSYEPAALAPFLPTLREIGESFPSLIGQTAKIFGAVGHLDEERARTSLLYLVNQLANMEHSFHHLLLLEIKSLTDTFCSILGTQSRDIYRMSNSFSAIARLLARQLGTDGAAAARMENDPEAECPLPLDDLKSVVNGSEEDEKLQVKIQAFEEKINVDNSTPGSVRRYSLGQVSKEERKDMRFNRSKSLALHALRVKGLSSEGGQDEESGDIPAGISFSELCLSQEHQEVPFGVQPEAGTCLLSQQSAELPQPARLPDGTLEQAGEGRAEAATDPEEHQDKLYLHLKENLGRVKEYVVEMGRRIPIPEHCVIEDSVQSCVAKLFFSCALKGHYCLYSKSSFTLVSQQPPLWIHIMFLFQQSLFAEPLSLQSSSVQVLKALWEKTQLKGTHSFETAMIQSTFPHQKDLENIQMHLEEVRFFDLFGYSEEAGAWQCFMCNNPEKATGVHQDGQPLMEGQAEGEAGALEVHQEVENALLHPGWQPAAVPQGQIQGRPRRVPIELSKVQSVKVVAKKRRDRSLPRAFEIFTESRSYVLKAEDEKKAEQWLQCLSVAVAQARERQSHEATTFL
uniref:Ventricular zone expressed PH domain containing 1 n=1 Tax=Taeniopygia guttata TaxID=59729 RepID=A0A674GZA6_TAEGU